ncbi:MAG: rhodanese-like domain-containing protein [Melioribacter sp.]|uniref:rhodanese-like domain-containing protein n=1 Tax=Rosettibacter primus TaxID=3111523 RepID=UPI00247D3296|nr:rhodanese-like domain-containing protein [Melioribacter sp.]
MDLEKYLSSFDYEAQKKIKIQIPELMEILKKGEIQFIDVRFKEEIELWNFIFSKNIPLNNMPYRLNEIKKDKLVVTACPHYDRAIITRMFLIKWI